MSDLDRLDQAAAPDPIGPRYNRAPRDVPPAGGPVRVLRRAKVTAKTEAAWITAVAANPIVGTLVITTVTLNLKATSQPAGTLNAGEPAGTMELRVGFKHIAVGDVVGYAPYSAEERAETGFDGVLVPHAGDAGAGAQDTGPYLTSLGIEDFTADEIWIHKEPASPGIPPEVVHIAANNDGNNNQNAPTVAGGAGASVVVEVIRDSLTKHVLGVKRVTINEANLLTATPPLYITAGVLSLSYNLGLQVTVAGGVSYLEAKPDILRGINVDANGLFAIVNGDRGIAVDGSGLALKLEAEINSSLAFDITTHELTHAIQAPTLGVGAPNIVAGENLKLSNSPANAMFDPNGHYAPDLDNTLVHDTHGAAATTFQVDVNGEWLRLKVDANGHVVNFAYNI